MSLNKTSKTHKNRNQNKAPWADFPDCPICRAMNEGQGNTLQELKKAFKDARVISKIEKI